MNNNNKIIRTICYFDNNPNPQTIKCVDKIAGFLLEKDFEIQTKRICSNLVGGILRLDQEFAGQSCIFSVGTLSYNQLSSRLNKLLSTKDISFNIDLTKEEISLNHIQLLFDIIKKKPSKTFNFTYVFNNSPQTPFFPAASYVKNGFSIGFQPTNLAENCKTLDEWLGKMKQVWNEIFKIFKNKKDFFGIDSSIAPFSIGKGSLINFIKKLGFTFSSSTTTDVYLKITNFLKENNPKPVGLCGLMFPCLEDFELTEEYGKGNFSLERNVYLSLHSGLGIDTYPIGIDEDKKRVLEILLLIQRLSSRYRKPLSVRFVSDGKAKIGEKTDFKNQYLKDVIVKTL